MDSLKKILQSPYALGLLAGLYPILFHMSINWYAFQASRLLFIIVSFSFIVFVSLSTPLVFLSLLNKKIFKGKQEKLVEGVFVSISILVIGHLFRHTIFELVGHRLYAIFIVILIAFVLGGIIHRLKMLRLNCIILMLCFISIGNGLYSVITNASVAKDGYLNQNESYSYIHEAPNFRKRPNVYYLIPDSYPNRVALKRVFGIDNSEFYNNLESLGFTLYNAALSNYMSTIPSVTSIFSMEHHYYRQFIGNSEMLFGREFITGKRNPVTNIFKNNDYRVDYIHQSNYLLTRGCFVDYCSPTVFWGDIKNILIPSKITQIIKNIIKDRLPWNIFEKRVKENIDKISSASMNYFMYIHMYLPQHSKKEEQTGEELLSFRRDNVKKIRLANENIISFITYILAHDPTGLIIVGADHGACGFGNPMVAKKEIFEGVTEEVVGLDHLGILLAIRWPESPPKYTQNIKTNVNLFRYIFSYLSESEKLLTTQAPDHGYILKRRGKGRVVMKVAHDGEIQKRMIELSKQE